MRRSAFFVLISTLLQTNSQLITVTGDYDSADGEYVFSNVLGIGSLNFKLPFRVDLYNPLIVIPSTWCSECTTGIRFNPTLSYSYQNQSSFTYKQLDLYSSTMYS